MRILTLAGGYGVWPAGMDYGVTLSNAHDLSEYDALIVQPTFRWLVKTDPDWGTTGTATFGNKALFDSRRIELLRLLRRGGVVLVFLGPLSAQGGTPRHAISFITGSDDNAMGIETKSGRSLEVLDAEHPAARYLQGDLTWIATMKRGALAPDPFGSALAVSREGEFVAYEELFGGGHLLWLPPPATAEHWRMLFDLATRVWELRSELAAGSEQEAALLEDVARLDADHRAKRQSLMNDLRRIREMRLRFGEEDPAVQRARAFIRAAKSYGPAKALRTYADLLEFIEQQYGGERPGREALGYSANAAAKITGPANKREYFSRHPGSGEPVPVPAEVLSDAAEVAEDVLKRFVDKRFAEWTERARDTGA
jgi:hypothetical protein